VLRHIRVICKDELKERLIAFIGDINREPVVHTWRYKIDNADRGFESCSLQRGVRCELDPTSCEPAFASRSPAR
jgi:hypothetical protein